MDNSTIGDMAANVRYYFDRDAAKQALKEKYEAKMLFAYGDGMWKAGPELLGVLHLWHGASGWGDTEASAAKRTEFRGLKRLTLGGL